MIQDSDLIVVTSLLVRNNMKNPYLKQLDKNKRWPRHIVLDNDRCLGQAQKSGGIKLDNGIRRTILTW
jgi:hypothetical protein